MCSSCSKKFVFAFSFDEQLQQQKKREKGSEGIVIAELWFHLAQPGTPGGTGYSVLLLPSQIAEWIVSRWRADIESRSEQWPKCRLHRCKAQLKVEK